MILAFDVYGTLIDPYSMESQLAPIFRSRAAEATRLWREKQIEYSFRRALMERYADFGTCTEQALDYVALRLGMIIAEDAKKGMLDRYRRLPPFSDAAPALENLARSGHRLVAFSNGTAAAI